MKILFVTHDISVYGASRSLQALMRRYNREDVSIDLMVPKRLVRGNDLADIRRRFGSRIEKIFECFLPFDPIWKDATPLTALRHVNNIMSKLLRAQYKAIVKNGRYDIVHLNSIVLHSLVYQEHNVVVHVREIFGGKHFKAVQNLRRAAAHIYIDNATARALSKWPMPKATILNNPFDMTGVESATMPGFENEKRTVIAMIGQLSENKGTDFIIRAFLSSSKSSSSLLLIVGDGEAGYIVKCKELTKNSSNVIFYGEESEIIRVYGVADYVIRGDSEPCIGRTTYEGLFSGCDVIVPGDHNLDIESRFQNKVHYYPPRNTDALVSVLDRLAGNKVRPKQALSNVEEYVDKFHAFISEVAESEKAVVAR